MEGELKGGRYRIEHPPIGEGGMGIVYRACDTRLDCTVALKEIKPEHLHDSQFRRRFALEAKLAAGRAAVVARPPRKVSLDSTAVLA